MGYDAVGNILSATDPNGHATAFTYNALNQVVTATAPSPFNFETHYRYDANGNLVQVDRQAVPSAPGPLPALGTTSGTDSWQSTVYAYTALDQLAAITDDLAQTTAYTYDATGNRTSMTDAKGQTTTSTYDERNLLWKVTDAATPAGVTESRYDPNGHLAMLLDAKGNPTTYAYDEFDRLTRLTYADGSHEAYAYDAASNLTSRTTPAGQTLSYAYDALNRLTSKTTPEQTTTYSYDPGSRLTAAVDNGSLLTWSYDPLHRVTQARTLAPGLFATLAYAYDPAGNRTQRTDHQGATVTSAYDALNRLTQITDAAGPVATFTYDALSRRSDLQLANGTTTLYQYTATNQLQYLRTTNTAQTLLEELLYQYDPAGNPRLKVDDASLHLYAYDATHQLTQADYPASFPLPDTSFSYDPVGNRTQVTAGPTTPYTANALNQYTTVSVTNLTSDLNGNLTNDGIRSYTYDTENRLRTATGSFGTVTYTYDPLGRRLSNTLNGVTTFFLSDGDQLLAELDTHRVTTASYLSGPGIDEPLRLTRGSTSTYYHADSLGSITALTDATGALLERVSYDVFGTPRLTTPSGTVLPQSAVGNRLLFTGREYDPETGLYFSRNRYYDPRLGRFLSRDPLGVLPDVNLYRYVGNSPLTWIDPFGLEKQRGGQQNQTTTMLLPGISPGGPRFAHQDATGRRYWSSSARPTPAQGPSPLVRGVAAVGNYYNDPGRILRTTGRGLSEFDHPNVGRPMSITGLVLEPGGTGKIVGIAAGGTAGATLGRQLGIYIGGSTGGPLGGIVGGVGGGFLGGVVGGWFDPSDAGELE